MTHRATRLLLLLLWVLVIGSMVLFVGLAAYYSIGSNSCEWIGDEFECFYLLPWDANVLVPLSGVLSLAWLYGFIRLLRIKG